MSWHSHGVVLAAEGQAASRQVEATNRCRKQNHGTSSSGSNSIVVVVEVVAIEIDVVAVVSIKYAGSVFWMTSRVSFVWCAVYFIMYDGMKYIYTPLSAWVECKEDMY